MQGDQLVAGRGVGAGLQAGHDLQVCGVGEEVVGNGGGEFGEARVVRFPGRGFGRALDQGDEAGVVEGVLDMGEVVVEALGDQGPGQYPALPGCRHLFRGEAEAGHPLQQRHGVVGQQGPVSVGEPAQGVTPRDQLLDPFGELPFDVGERGGELGGVGVEQGPDLGQGHPGGGQRPDLHQP
ncbi:hypothetical protein ACFPOI_58255 [Nonomuraea angiospora]|uniref:Uncharacterized protein n=1 Tax=Nonomuraea angiospora TaxID=46172 RepID=A0ABR9LR23_9ACTN|nr:hypothetical protein [Nonomuraea angiospora]MBE1583109.1 hypothetical protein [Nonomuraea angiospora]